jgi:hypothetical protein
MIEPQPGGALPAVAHVVPEGVDGLVWVRSGGLAGSSCRRPTNLHRSSCSVSVESSSHAAAWRHTSAGDGHEPLGTVAGSAHRRRISPQGGRQTAALAALSLMERGLDS